MIVDAPRSSKIQPSTELVVPCNVRRNGRVLIQKRIGRTELPPRELSDTVGHLIDRPKNRSKWIRLDKWIRRNFRQYGCIYVECCLSSSGCCLT